MLESRKLCLNLYDQFCRVVETLKRGLLINLFQSGDVSGSRPGMMDFVKRAKYDAHAKLKGIAKDDAQKKYIDLVSSLLGAEAATPASKSVEGLTAVPGVDVSEGRGGEP